VCDGYVDVGGCTSVLAACRTTDLCRRTKSEAVLTVKLDDCLFVVREGEILPDDGCA